MKFYLSYYRIGEKAKKLKEMIPKSKKIGFIPNALDYTDDLERRESIKMNIKSFPIWA